MKAPFGILAALLFFPFQAECKIGETVEQCVARYGEPLAITGELGWFRKSVYFIECWFHEGKWVFAVLCGNGGKSLLKET